MRRSRAAELCLLSSLLSLAAAQSSSGTPTSATPATTSGPSQAVIISGTPVAPASATYTTLLPVPSYSFASSISPGAASSLESLIPSYTYNLTMESNSTRQAICDQQTQACSTAGCVQNGANVTTDFCTVSTMGWNCACSSGDSRLLSYEAPVNLFDCQLRNGKCQEACQNPTATPRVTNMAGCIQACNTLIGQTCGQPNQISVNYKVNSPSDTPSYAGNTAQGGAATRSAAAVISVATFLSIVAGAAIVVLHAS